MTEAAREVDGITAPPAGEWELDPAHTMVEFVARHILTKVRGRFTEFSGTIEIGDRPEDTHVEVEIQAASIQTNQEMRDNHQKSGDFLEIEKYPTLTFRTTAFRPTGGARFELDGELTVKDDTKAITLEGEFLGWGPAMEGRTVLGASARTTVDREDWGMTWNMIVETGGFLVSKKVDIEIEVEAYLAG